MQNDISKILKDIETGNALDAIEGAKELSRYRLSDEQIDVLIKIPEIGNELHNKKAATYALAFIENSEKCQIALIGLLGSSNNHEEVRGHAAEGIGIVPISDNRIREMAENILFKSLRDPSPVVRFWSCYAVGRIGIERAIPILEDLKFNDTEICPGWWYISEEAEDAIEWINGRDGKDRIPVKDRKITESGKDGFFSRPPHNT